MEKDTLSQVIETEKEIQKRMEVEKLKVAEWLENAKKEAEAAYLREERNIRASIDQQQAEATKKIDEKVAVILEQAAREAERFGSVEPVTLKRIVEKHLGAILPE